MQGFKGVLADMTRPGRPGLHGDLPNIRSCVRSQSRRNSQQTPSNDGGRKSIACRIVPHPAFRYPQGATRHSFLPPCVNRRPAKQGAFFFCGLLTASPPPVPCRRPRPPLRPPAPPPPAAPLPFPLTP